MYYRMLPMPSLSERKNILLEYAQLNGVISDQLEPTIDKIISKTTGYSYDGYYAFGINEEKSQLQKVFSCLLK